MVEINLLRSLPKVKRNVKMRSTAKTDEHIRISKQYGQMYFDGFFLIFLIICGSSLYYV